MYPVEEDGNTDTLLMVGNGGKGISVFVPTWGNPTVLVAVDDDDDDCGGTDFEEDDERIFGVFDGVIPVKENDKGEMDAVERIDLLSSFGLAGKSSILWEKKLRLEKEFFDITYVFRASFYLLNF